METMQAVTIERFGEAAELTVQSIPVPQIAANEVLIRVAYAGVGSWDVAERQGGYDRMLGSSSNFPYVLGSEGAGEVVAIGSAVTRFRPGQAVMATGFLNPKGGFYAQYVAVNEQTVAPVPAGYSAIEASVVLGVGITALRGVIDTLGLSAHQSLGILGASGGIGHVALQIANAIGADVCALASGSDGTLLARGLGAGSVYDGRAAATAGALRQQIGGRFDAVLLTAGGELADQLCKLTKPGGTIAFPAGVHPEPVPPEGVACKPYYGEPTQEITARLIRLIDRHGIKPHVSAVFAADQAAHAHRKVVGHHLGKIALDIGALEHTTA